MPRHSRKHPASTTALVPHRAAQDLGAAGDISPDEAVRLAVKVLQEASAIVPASAAVEDVSESDDEGAETAAPAFIKKLKQLIDDAEIDSIMWTEDGTSFVIHEPKRLSEQLVKYFKSSKLKSFVRQLHFYGFKKVGGTRFDDWVYNHKFFQRDGRLVHKLRRKTCGPDQQIRNLQTKVDSLQGSLVDTQHKLGDMAVALMALLQHHNAATFLGSQRVPQQHQAPRPAVTQDRAPAKRPRPSATAITRFEQPPVAASGGGGVKHEARRLPVAIGGYNELLGASMKQQPTAAMALTPISNTDSFDLAAEFDDLFNFSAGEEFGLFTDLETRVTPAGHAVGVTA